MSNVYPMVSSGERRKQASEWIAKLDRELSGQEHAELDAWVTADERNRRELLACAELWDMMGALQSLGVLVPREPQSAPQKTSWRPMAIAASLVVALVTGLLMVAGSPFEQQSRQPLVAAVPDLATYTTPVGDQSTVHLKDGSVVQLNTDTRLQVRMTPQLRLLTLERGEIHIDVAHDPDRPLRVIAGDKMFEAIGTAFNVKIDEGQDVELIVTEGRVRVQLRAEAVTIADSDTGLQTLERGERILLNESPQVESMVEDDIEVKLAWRDGILVFRGSSLKEAVREVGRYTHMEFVIQSDDLEQRRVAGVFKAGDIEGFLASLRANFDVVDRRIDENTISLSLKPAAGDI